MFPFDKRLRGCIPASYEQADGSFVTETCERETVHAICLSEPGEAPSSVVVVSLPLSLAQHSSSSSSWKGTRIPPSL